MMSESIQLKKRKEWPSLSENTFYRYFSFAILSCARHTGRHDLFWHTCLDGHEWKKPQ